MSLGAAPEATATPDASSANTSTPPVNTSTDTNTSTVKPQAGANSTTSQGNSAAAPLRYPGTWGLFRFVAAGGGTANKQPSGEYLLNYKLGGKTVIVTVKGDLFDRSLWQARAPQNLLK
jgi:hypothetical protein